MLSAVAKLSVFKSPLRYGITVVEKHGSSKIDIFVRITDNRILSLWHNSNGFQNRWIKLNIGK